MDPKLLEIQRQIKENSMSVSDYLKDLHEWEKEINTKDKILKTQSQGNNVNKEKSKNSEKTPNKLVEKIPTQKILKRDKNSINEYYDAWNKIDIGEEELMDKEESQIVTNSQEDSIQKEFFTNPKKISNARANTSIKIKNNRQGLHNPEEYIDKIKTEANAYFAIGNYNKSIELNMAVLKFLDEDSTNIASDTKIKLKIAICNNRGSSHLKLSNFKEAIKDFNYVLENDNKNLKALFRRGYSYFKIRQLSKQSKIFRSLWI
jgi:tetratricopeptide (TPR) repeat protein